MWIICDKTDVVQDRASKESSLDRGYDYDEYKIYELPNQDIRVGDTYKDGVHTKNTKFRAKRELENVLKALIDLNMRIDKALALGHDYDSVRVEYQDERTVLLQRKGNLNSIINVTL